MHALFVHGMGRTPLSGLPLLRRLHAANIATSTFAYSAATHDFARIAARLASRIAQTAERGDYVLIGHSLGGVLLRSALASLPADSRAPRRVFLLGSPISPARLAKRLQRKPIYRLLTRDCGQLLASGERMNRIGPLAAPTTAIFGVRGIRPTRHLFGDEANDGVVAVVETRASWIADEVRIPVMHSFLPSSRRVAELILARIDGGLKPAHDDLENRRPIWHALSELFLDTDISSSSNWRTRVLSASPYSVDDLETILIDEVYPARKYKRLCVAGEWAGFDQQWLEEKILLCMASRWRILPAKNPRRLPTRVSSEWRLTKAAIRSARKSSQQQTNERGTQ